MRDEAKNAQDVIKTFSESGQEQIAKLNANRVEDQCAGFSVSGAEYAPELLEVDTKGGGWAEEESNFSTGCIESFLEKVYRYEDTEVAIAKGVYPGSAGVVVELTVDGRCRVSGFRESLGNVFSVLDRRAEHESPRVGA
jgi:hypothetical protein